MKYREVEKGHCMYPKNGNGDSQYVHWIENRLPSGDCQPYVAAFTTLLAAFDAFRKIAKVNSNGDLQLENGQPQLRNDAMVERKDYEIPSDFQKARKVFANGKIFESALNKLDPEGKLGTELFNLEIENQAKVRRKVKTLPTEAQNSTGAVRS
jgi:hypothetical protein